MPLDLRFKVARLVLALSQRNPSLVASCEREVRVVRKHHKEDVIYRMDSFWLDRDSEDIMQGLNIFDFLLWGESEDPVISQPEGYFMACRCSFALRSLALAFGVRLST